ncbi:MAG: Maf family protein [bacterium]
MRLVLASQSPRRSILLKFLVDDFAVAPTPVEEVAPRALSIAEAVSVIARKKALATSEKDRGAFVLAADTVVACRDELVDKAVTPEEMRQKLAFLSGTTHQVWTGLALAWDGRAVDASHAVTAVLMERMPAAVVDAYADSGLWQGKAGGYGIQDTMLQPYVRIQAGPWSNVVGLPLAATRDLLRRNGITTRDPPDEAWLRDHNPFESPSGSPNR